MKRTKRNQSTITVGKYTIQEQNMIVPDGKKTWVVRLDGKVVVSYPRKAEAIEYATLRQ